ncbi:MAG: ROK family protein, partial [Parafannyhessea umbonata]|nr:ROK family protein [Parafannyhessea umbonata]
EVFALADGGDAVALAVLEHAAECLARGVNNINAVVDPDVFVFGGSVALKNPGFMDLVFQKAKRYVLDPDSLLFREATCGEDAGLVGAALLV